jgi:hypothetical protein
VTRLRDLAGVVKPVGGAGPGVHALRFRCPACPSGHTCVVPFHDGAPVADGAVGKLWHRVGGSTVDDLTLEPSYQLPCLHVTVVRGELVPSPG